VDRFEGTAWLDWWANSSTNLGGIEVLVTVTHTAGAWEARGHLIDDHDEVREGFAFLCDLDPAFTLRFVDEATLQVIAHASDDHRRFTLIEDTGADENTSSTAWNSSHRPDAQQV
jgi:hypothetical protein